jgi:hypothetical protein
MRKKGFFIWASLFVTVLFISMGILQAFEEQSVPDEMDISNEVYKSDRKGPVPFSHVDHAEDYDLECTACHHEYEDGENVWDEGKHVKKCVECHDPLKNEGEVKRLKIAFHKNCKNCHRKIVEEEISEDAPYKKCNGCHQKKS